MATKSSTKRKSAPKKKLPVEAVIEKAKDLLDTEKNTFIVSKLSDTQYRVGKFVVTGVDDYWYVDATKSFNSRMNAVAYCALIHIGYGNNANSLFDLDQKVQKLIDDKLLYERKLVKSIRSKDEWKTNLYSARYADAKAQLQKFQSELQKTLNLAKYIKLWSDQ
jgi:hypothetical protein